MVAAVPRQEVIHKTCCSGNHRDDQPHSTKLLESITAPDVYLKAGIKFCKNPLPSVTKQSRHLYKTSHIIQDSAVGESNQKIAIIQGSLASLKYFLYLDYK